MSNAGGTHVVELVGDMLVRVPTAGADPVNYANNAENCADVRTGERLR